MGPFTTLHSMDVDGRRGAVSLFPRSLSVCMKFLFLLVSVENVNIQVVFFSEHHHRSRRNDGKRFDMM